MGFWALFCWFLPWFWTLDNRHIFFKWRKVKGTVKVKAIWGMTSNWCMKHARVHENTWWETRPNHKVWIKQDTAYICFIGWGRLYKHFILLMFSLVGLRMRATGPKCISWACIRNKKKILWKLEISKQKWRRIFLVILNNFNLFLPWLQNLAAFIRPTSQFDYLITIS